MYTVAAPFILGQNFISALTRFLPPNSRQGFRSLCKTGGRRVIKVLLCLPQINRSWKRLYKRNCSGCRHERNPFLLKQAGEPTLSFGFPGIIYPGHK